MANLTNHHSQSDQAGDRGCHDPSVAGVRRTDNPPAVVPRWHGPGSGRR